MIAQKAVVSASTGTDLIQMSLGEERRVIWDPAGAIHPVPFLCRLAKSRYHRSLCIHDKQVKNQGKKAMKSVPLFFPFSQKVLLLIS